MSDAIGAADLRCEALPDGRTIVRTDRPTVIHHRRGDGELIETRIVTSGSVALDPPGIALELARIYG